MGCGAGIREFVGICHAEFSYEKLRAYKGTTENNQQEEIASPAPRQNGLEAETVEVALHRKAKRQVTSCGGDRKKETAANGPSGSAAAALLPKAECMQHCQ
jgi:hypothetical protein